jgi:hypothetical protein
MQGPRLPPEHSRQALTGQASGRAGQYLPAAQARSLIALMGELGLQRPVIAG